MDVRNSLGDEALVRGAAEDVADLEAQRQQMVMLRAAMPGVRALMPSRTIRILRHPENGSRKEGQGVLGCGVAVGTLGAVKAFEPVCTPHVSLPTIVTAHDCHCPRFQEHCLCSQRR
eukprot:1584147-Rhodomonas_salina.1